MNDFYIKKTNEDVMQMIPAPQGWIVTHKENRKKENGGCYYRESSVICWALQRGGNVVPLICDSSGYLYNPLEDHGFVDVYKEEI